MNERDSLGFMYHHTDAEGVVYVCVWTRADEAHAEELGILVEPGGPDEEPYIGPRSAKDWEKSGMTPVEYVSVRVRMCSCRTCQEKLMPILVRWRLTGQF